MTNGQYSQKYHPVLSYILSKLIPKNILNGLEMRCILGTFVLMNKKKIQDASLVRPSDLPL